MTTCSAQVWVSFLLTTTPFCMVAQKQPPSKRKKTHTFLFGCSEQETYTCLESHLRVKPGASTRRVPTHGRLAEAVDIIGPGSKTRDVEAAQLPDNQCRWPVFGHLKDGNGRKLPQSVFQNAADDSTCRSKGVPSMMGSFNDGVPSQAIQAYSFQFCPLHTPGVHPGNYQSKKRKHTHTTVSYCVLLATTTSIFAPTKNRLF